MFDLGRNMSFGVPASARRRPATGHDCPCGSAAAFADCCGPVLDGAATETAEALMRSRFTAFAIGDAAHILASWHPGTRPAGLDLAGGPRWLRLEVIDAQGGPGDRRGVVSFRAHWRDGGTGERGVLAERSRFVRQSERWWYLDGDVRDGV